MSCTQFQEIIIPETVTSIGKAAFYKCTARIINSNSLDLTNAFRSPSDSEESPSTNNTQPIEPNHTIDSNFQKYSGNYTGIYFIMEQGYQQEELGRWSGYVDESGNLSFKDDNGRNSLTKLSPDGTFVIDDGKGPRMEGIIQNGNVSGTVFDIEMRPMAHIQGRKE